MMKIEVERFDVGPILGAVAADSARLWGRGREVRSGDALRRVFGAARIRPAGGDFGPAQFFKLNPNFDLTGVTVFQGLAAGSEHEYEIGAFFSDLEFADLAANAELDWSRAHRAAFRTASADSSAGRSFVFGSCRYLLKLFGASLFDDRGDKTFRSIREQIDAGRATDQLLMLGDQIYADDLNFLLPDQRVDEYFRRYREVFSQENFALVTSRIPTYMTLDDHEIEDNWPARASSQDVMRKYPAAMHAYLSYQLSHSPLFEFGGDGRLTEQPDRYWYRFSDGCCDFFVTDLRTERHYGPNDERIAIMRGEQMSALKDWLSDGSGRVKLIASSVPFFPDLAGGSDRWDSFPGQRNEILNHIRENRIRRVVFLSGDVHSSMSAELIHPADPNFKIVSVVSSPFYWPYPHSFSKDFQIEGGLAHSNGYELREAGPIYSTDNFTRVTVDLSRLQVEFFKRKGEPLAEPKVHPF